MNKKTILIATTFCMLLSSCGTNMDRESHFGNSAEEKNESTTDVSLSSDKGNAEQFTAITEGDFSVVNVDDKQKERMEDIYSLMIERGIASTWHYFDVTGDGVDELIWEDISPFDENFKTVIAVFKSTKSGVERLHWDVNDNSRYLFIGDNNLVSYDDVGSAFMYVCFRETLFDSNNDSYWTYSISMYIIDDYDDIMDHADLESRFIEKGISKEGIYYFKTQYSMDGSVASRTSLNKDLFLESFHDLTGDSFEVREPYWSNVIESVDPSP